jgi:tRNA(His) guanylyltransferase
LNAHPKPPVKNAEKVLGTAYFDGRLFAVPSAQEALNCVMWRCRGDAIRNSVSTFARTFYSSKQLHKKTTAEKLEMIEAASGASFKNSVPSWAKEGTVIKKEQYDHEGKNEKTGQMEKTLRTRPRAVDKGVTKFSDANMRLVTEKYWNTS